MRALWNGSLSFGLVNIPVSLYSAAEERALSFKLFDKHGNCPISYIKVCREDHKEVPKEDIVKGYEYQKGDYVVLDEKDFKKAAPEKTDHIDILQFSDIAEVDPMYFEKPYYIEPDKKAGKAYSLLRDALLDSKKVGIARFVMKNKEHIAAIIPHGNILILLQLRFQDEIRKPDLKIPPSKYTKAELETGLKLIDQLTKKIDLKKYKDTYTIELMKVIKAKAKGKRIKVKEEKPKPNTEMKDLMKALKMSLEMEKYDMKPKSHGTRKI
jgi:DNA end-binding protein Ku